MLILLNKYCIIVTVAGNFHLTARSAIAGEPLQPEAWQKIQDKEAALGARPERPEQPTPAFPPTFTKHLTNAENVVEGSHVFIEAQVEPRADPNLRIEWFKNGMSLTTGARIRTTFDFGLVTLSVNGARPDDSGIYTCRAVNLLGEAVSTCSIKVEGNYFTPTYLKYLQKTTTPDSELIVIIFIHE